MYVHIKCLTCVNFIILTRNKINYREIMAGLSNLLLLSQLAGNIIVLILSLCITIPMSVHEDDFR